VRRLVAALAFGTGFYLKTKAATSRRTPKLVWPLCLAGAGLFVVTGLISWLITSVAWSRTSQFLRVWSV